MDLRATFAAQQISDKRYVETSARSVVVQSIFGIVMALCIKTP